jgi:cytochrome P450
MTPSATTCPTAPDFDPFDGTPHQFYRQARHHRPVFHHAPTKTYVLTRYHDCKALLANHSGTVSASVAIGGHLLFAPNPQAGAVLAQAEFAHQPTIVDEDGQDHRRHRAATQPPFNPARVRELKNFIHDQVAQRIERISGNRRADLVDELVYDVPAAVILHMMGIPDDQLGLLKDFRGPYASFIWGTPDDATQLEVARGMAAFWRWAQALVQDRLARPGSDIISAAITRLRSQLPEEKLAGFVSSYALNIIMAGHETTVNTAAYGLLHLLQQRDQWQSLVDDPTLIPNAVEELLRYSTGVPAWRQLLTAATRFSEVELPAGSIVYAAIISANRDEEVFGATAESLDIYRTSARRHLAFGTGVHTCGGNHLARLELSTLLEELTAKLPTLRLQPDQRFTFAPNTSQRGPEHLHVVW